MKEALTDNELEKLQEKGELLWAQLKMAEEMYDRKRDEWCQVDRQITAERTRRQIKAEVMKELGQ